MTLADQVRTMLENPRRHVHGSETVALRAVVEKCEWMPTDYPEVGERIATNLLTVVARELGITTEETS